MPSKGRKFITEFLLPNLNSKKFDSRLQWLNIDEAVFQLQWSHKSASDWKKRDAEVFVEWDKMKGHYRPDEKDYFTKSKQRFRAVLYKLIREHQITEVWSKDKSTKIYCIGRRESWELDNIMSFKFHSSPSYSVENPVESIIEDHKYSLSEQGVSENEDDLLSLYPAPSLSCSSYSKSTSSKTESVSKVDENSFDNHLFAPSDQPPLHVDYIIIKDSLENEEHLNLEDFKLLRNIDENSSTYQAEALRNTTQETCNFQEDYSNYVQSFLPEINLDRRNDFGQCSRY